MAAALDTSLLDNIVWHTLSGAQSRFSAGNARARRYAAGLPALAAFPDRHQPDLDALAPFCEAADRIFTTFWTGPVPSGWRVEVETSAEQYVWDREMPPADPAPEAVRLDARHAERMVELATLTRPGPTGPRQFELGEYYGLFDGERLLAIAGERMHAGNFREVSLVCTHPDFQGRGLARRLTEKVVRLQMGRGQVPFLHVMAANSAARALYERMGFRRHQNVPLRVLARD